MKFLPEEKKKRFWSLALLLVAVAGIIYFNFFVGAPAPSRQLSQTEIPATTTPAAPERVPATSFLPYGKKLELLILEEERFKVLRAAPRIQVLPEELGKPDPFAR